MEMKRKGVSWGKYALMALVIGVGVGIVAPLVAQGYNWIKNKATAPKS